MSDLVNLLWAALLLAALVVSYSDLVVRRWDASGWSFVIAVVGPAAFLAVLPEVLPR